MSNGYMTLLVGMIVGLVASVTTSRLLAEPSRR